MIFAGSKFEIFYQSENIKNNKMCTWGLQE